VKNILFFPAAFLGAVPAVRSFMNLVVPLQSTAGMEKLGDARTHSHGAANRDLCENSRLRLVRAAVLL
jgi:hypothetical protein